jgi:hypothetical protein
MARIRRHSLPRLAGPSCRHGENSEGGNMERDEYGTCAGCSEEEEDTTSGADVEG